MFNKMVLLAKKTGLSRAEFRQHWSGPHAGIIKAIIQHFAEPGAVRYTQNRVEKVVWQKPGAEEFDVEGIVELHVPTAKPSTDALSSGAVQKMLDDEFRFLRGLTECIIRPEGPDDVTTAGPSTKLIALCEREPGCAELDYAQRLRSQLAKGRHGIRHACFNWVESVVHRDGLWHEPVDPDVQIELWFDDTKSSEQARSAFQSLNSVVRRTMVYHVDPLKIL
jgi:hypothetical protein